MEKQSKDYEKNENDWTDREIQSETLSFMTSAMIKDIFKQTEIGEWEEAVFSEAIDVNPKRELKKGQSAKCVSMIDIEPFKRKISNFSIKEFKGGSKFRNKDTLFARITPCLENGKTAFVDILDNGEIGFGSTEFIVLSAKEEKTDSYFVYYLSRSPEIRKVAIKSMTGTSGRQRVENEVFDTIIINLPPVSEQSSIAKILSDLDSKIELNQQMNKTLESICHAIFKHWFVDFEFPNEKGKPYKSSGGKMVDSELGKIPEGWGVSTLREFITIERGLSYKGSGLTEHGLPMINLANFAPNHGFIDSATKPYSGEYKARNLVKAGDIVIANTDITQKRDVLGSPAIVPNLASEKILFTHHVYAVRNKSWIPNYFIYYLLQLKQYEDRTRGFETGTTVLFLPDDAILDFHFVLSNRELVEKFVSIMKIVQDRLNLNTSEHITLTI